MEVYTTSTVQNAWAASGCWPIDLDRAREAPESAESETETNIHAHDDPLLDTPLRIRKLARGTQKIIMNDDLDKGAKVAVFQSLIDVATDKIATYRDIAPRALTLTKLRNGKTRTKRGPSRQVGTGRVLSRKVLNEGLKKLELAEAARVVREKAALERRLASEEKKNAKQALERQWKLDMDAYTKQLDAWREESAVLEATWREQRDQARIAHQRPLKKPIMPIRPKRPIKPKCGDLTIIQEAEEVEEGEPNQAGEPVDDNQLEDNENEELNEYIQDFNLERFTQML